MNKRWLDKLLDNMGLDTIAGCAWLGFILIGCLVVIVRGS